MRQENGHPSDAELLDRLRAGDELAFERLYARYRPPLTRYAERLLAGRRASADDVVQDAFIAAHRMFRADSRELSVRPYLYRAVHNRSIDALRGEPARAAVPDEGTRSEEDPAAVVLRREAVREVLADIVRLPDRQRDALLATVGGTPHAVLARRLNTSPGGAKALVARARSTVRASQAERALRPAA